MGGCPSCGAPVGDTDFACRQCGRSFVADPSTIGGGGNAPAAITSDPDASFQYFQNRPSPGAYPSANANATDRFCPEAARAMRYAIIGVFCAGFVCGALAIKLALEARTKIAQNPGMRGGTEAAVGLYLGVVDVLGWIWAMAKFVRPHH